MNLFDNFKRSGAASSSRRWFIANAFDGTLSVLAIIVGMFTVGISNPMIVFATGSALCIALSISQSAGNYMTERAERIRSLKDLEGSMLAELDNSIQARTAARAPILVALIGGVLSAGYVSIALVPFAFSVFGLMNIVPAFYTAFGIAISLLSILGVILARISRENAFLMALAAAAIGTLSAIGLFFLLHL